MKKIKKIVKSILPNFLFYKIKLSINYLSSLISYFNHKKVFNRKVAKPAKILFLVCEPQTWSALKPIYEAADKSPDAEAIVVAVQNKMMYNGGHKTNVIDFFKHECNNTINADMGNGKYVDISKLKPDIIFRQTTHDDEYPSVYCYKRISKIAKTCYITYGYSQSSKNHLEIEYNDIALRSLYAIFANSRTNLNYLLLKKNEIRWNRYLKVFYLGYPRFDKYNRLSINIEQKDKFSTFLWIPRWTTNNEQNDATGFFEYKDNLINYFKKHEELALIIRPHPMMFGYFLKNGIMTQNQINEFLTIVRDSKNIRMDSDIDYRKAFDDSDALIADYSSLVIEYFITGKAIIYCGKVHTISPEIKDMYMTLYRAKNWIDLQKQLDTLIQEGDNLGRKRKALAIKFLSDMPKNSAEEIVKKCISF